MDLKKTSRRIDEIIVHCSATKEGKDFTVVDINRWHLQRGFACIGYHYVVYLDGSIHEGRNVEMPGAHCKNHNSHSIGVCYIGGLDTMGKPKDTRTVKQVAALRALLSELKKLYPNAKIHGHNEFSAKDCPCFNAGEEYADL